MENDFEFFDIAGFHSRYDEIRTHDNDLVIECVGIRQPVHDKEHAITIYTKAEMRERRIVRFLHKAQAMWDAWQNII